MSSETPSGQDGNQTGITLEKAMEIADNRIADFESDHDFVIIKEKIIEKPFGWVFFYSTRKHVETGDINYAVPGNGPLIVDRKDGEVTLISSSIRPELAIQEHEKQWSKK